MIKPLKGQVANMTTQFVYDFFNPENPTETWIRNGNSSSPMPDWVLSRLASGKRLDGCVLQDKPSALTYQQTDWTGETPVNDSTDHCPTCKGDMPFTFGVGRPAVYCSDSCKMKAYRMRKKNQNNGVFRNDDDDEEEARKTQSVGSDCNTHTKVLNPVLIDKNQSAFNTHTKQWKPTVNDKTNSIKTGL